MGGASSTTPEAAPAGPSGEQARQVAAAQKVLSGGYTWAEGGSLDPSLMGVLVPGTEPLSEGEP